MPALTAEAHNSDGVFAHLPVTFDTLATFLHNIVEFSASAARKRDTCVLAAVMAPFFVRLSPHIPARKHDVEANLFKPLFQQLLEFTARGILELFPHPHSSLGVRFNPHPQTGYPSLVHWCTV